MALQHLRSSTAHKRPIPTVMSAGQIAINTNEASPGLFFKDSNGDLVKVGPVHIGPDAPNSSPASVAATALVTGTVYQILTVGTSDFTLVGASANTVGTIFTATGTTTGTGTVSGQQGVEKGEQWLDTTGGTYVLKIYDGTAWRSESGTFVDVNGDTMTGALILPSGTAAAPALGVGSTDNGIYSPGANQVAISTNGTGRLFVDSSGNVGVGTTPSVPLEVSSSSFDSFKVVRTGAGTGAKIGLVNGDGNEFQIIHDGGENLVFRYGNTDEMMRLDSAGRLLVGTTTARGPLLQITEALGLGHAAMRTYSGTGDLTINLSRLRQVVGSVHRQAGGVIIYSGIQGNATNSTSLVCFFRVNGLSTYNAVSVTNIVGTTTLTLSNAASTSCTLTLDVGSSVEGSALVFLTSQSGGHLS